MLRAHHLGVGDVGGEAHGVHVVFVDRIEIVDHRILVPQVQEAVGGLRRILKAAFLHFALERGDLALVHGGLAAEVVQQQLERIQLAAQDFVFLLDLFLLGAVEGLVHPFAEGLLPLRLHAFGFRSKSKGVLRARRKAERAAEEEYAK